MEIDMIKILPEYFRPVLEFKEIIKADETVLSELETNIEQIRKNFYIQTADEAALAQKEALFGIFASPGEEIEYRRQRLLQKYNTIVPFSIDSLRDQMTELFGKDFTLSVDSVSCKLEVSVTSSRYGAVDLLYNLLWDVIPAHMEISANQEVNNYSTSELCVGVVMSRAFTQTI